MPSQTRKSKIEEKLHLIPENLFGIDIKESRCISKQREKIRISILTLLSIWDFSIAAIKTCFFIKKNEQNFTIDLNNRAMLTEISGNLESNG